MRGLLPKRPCGVNHYPYNEIIVKGACKMLDLRDTLSVPTRGVGARAGALAIGRPLFIILLGLFISLSNSVQNAYGWKNHSMNLKLQMRSTWYRDLTPRKQIKAHLDYLDHRYEGSACKALRHLIRKGWH